jgi:hypothetical protein
MSNEDESIFLPAILITSFVSTTSQFEQKALVESSNSNPLSKVPTIGKLISGRLRQQTLSHANECKNAQSDTKALTRIQ